MNKNKVWSIFGTGAEVIIYLVVMGFLFTESMNFFYFAFPPEQQNVAWLGLGLTGGGMIAYFIILKSGRADTDLKKAIILFMIAVCTLGELATAHHRLIATHLEKSLRSMRVVKELGPHL